MRKGRIALTLHLHRLTFFPLEEKPKRSSRSLKALQESTFSKSNSPNQGRLFICSPRQHIYHPEGLLQTRFMDCVSLLKSGPWSQARYSQGPRYNGMALFSSPDLGQHFCSYSPTLHWPFQLPSCHLFTGEFRGKL